MMMYDIAIVAGVSCIAYAGYQFHPALPWLICGSVAVTWGLFGAKLHKKGRDK